MNSFAPVDPSLVDVVLPEDEQGYPDALAAEDREAGVLWDCCGSASRDFPKSLWIEASDRADKARDNDKYNTWPVNYVDRFTNQQPTHECTCHSLRTNFEAARNRARGVIYQDGPKKDYRYPESSEYGSVWFSAMWPYNKANPNIRGGANVRQVMEIVCQYGMMPEKTQPREYGFKHQMPGTMGQGNSNNSSGKWVSVRNMPEGWEETAQWFKPLEVIFPDSWEQALCLVLNGITVSVGRNGHAVPWSFWNADEQMMGYVDSYNVIRYDSLRTVKSSWQGAFAIASVSVPDDWSKPAG